MEPIHGADFIRGDIFDENMITLISKKSSDGFSALLW